MVDAEAREESGFTEQGLRRMRDAVCLAEEVGEGVG